MLRSNLQLHPPFPCCDNQHLTKRGLCHAVRAPGANVTSPDDAGVDSELGRSISTTTWPVKFFASARTDAAAPTGLTVMLSDLAAGASTNAMVERVAAMRAFFMDQSFLFGMAFFAHCWRFLSTSATTGPAEKAFGQPA